MSDFDPSKPLANPKHEAFVQNLALGQGDLEAYVNAGYKENKGNASRLRTNENIVARLEWIMADAAGKVGIDVQRVLNMLMENAEVCYGKRTVTQRVIFKKNGKPVTDEQGKPVVGEIETTMFDPAAGNKAMELIGQHLQMFPKAVAGNVKHDHNHEHDHKFAGEEAPLSATADFLGRIAKAGADTAPSQSKPH